VSLEVGLLRRQVEPLVGELPHPLAVALDHQLGGHTLGGRIDECARVAGGEEVNARVVGEEEFGGVKSGRRGERASSRPAGVVRGVRRIARVTGD
jgi:hypothetical protein